MHSYQIRRVSSVAIWMAQWNLNWNWCLKNFDLGKQKSETEEKNGKYIYIIM